MEPIESSFEIQILHQEGECLVVLKPGGLLTQAPPGIESMESLVRRYFRQENNVPITDSVYVGMPHRLDRPASGVMLFGQTKKTTRKLAQQFEKRTVKKTYWALIEGRPEEDGGAWSDHMRKIPGQPQSEIVSPDASDAQEARLVCQVIASDTHISLLEIQLETGRTHQIRLQTSSRGMPIVGDAQYGSGLEFGPATVDQRKRWIALHARSLDFWHPQLHRPVIVTADLPECWRQFPTEIPLARLCQERRGENPKLS